MHWRGATIVALLLAAPATGQAQAQDAFPTVRKGGPNQRLAADAWSAATREVARRWPACDTRYSPPRGQVTDGPIPFELAARFAILRRPQTPAEAALADETGPRAVLPIVNGLRSSVRLARTLGDGAQIRVFVGLGTVLPARRPEVCRTREAREIGKRTRDLPRQARRAAMRMQRTAVRFEERLAAQPTTTPPMIFVTVIGPSGIPRGGTSGAPLATRRSGGTLLTTLVPDGVARVELVLAGGRNPLSGRTYPSGEHLSSAVVDNIALAHTPRSVRDAFVTRQIWTAPDGTVVPQPQGP